MHGGIQGNHSSPAPIVSVNAKLVSSQFDDPDAIKAHHRNRFTAIRSNSTAEHPNQPSISVSSRSLGNNIEQPHYMGNSHDSSTSTHGLELRYTLRTASPNGLQIHE